MTTGHKVFVSYKYHDSQVRPINRGSVLANLTPTTARHYVDEIQTIIDDSINIYKGEDDGNDLSQAKDDTIATGLKSKIKDSSVTIVLVSKGMKTNEDEDNQWIPWEISYSLKAITSNGITSQPNGLLAVILPDENGSYAYYMEECAHCNVVNHKNEDLFQILGNNMFNLVDPNKYNSSCIIQHGEVYCGDIHSYAYQVKWDDFIKNNEHYINHAVNLRKNIDNYNIQKVIKK